MLKYLITFLCLLFSFHCYAGVNLANNEDDYLQASDSATLDMGTSDFSVSFWINHNSTEFDIIMCHGDTIASTFACSGNDSDEGWGIRLGADDATDDIQAYIADNDVSFVATVGTTNLSTNTWYHVAVTFDRDGNVNTYIDGGSAEGTSDISGQAATISANGDFFIGKRARAPSNESYVTAKISEVALWKGILLTANERTLLASSRVKRIPLQIQPGSLIAYWPLDDGVGSSINGDIFKDMTNNDEHFTGTDADADAPNIPEEILSYP